MQEILQTILSIVGLLTVCVGVFYFVGYTIGSIRQHKLHLECLEEKINTIKVQLLVQDRRISEMDEHISEMCDAQKQG